MQPAVWKGLVSLILGMSANQVRIGVGFGGGETFLHFEETLQFLDLLRHLAAEKGVEVGAQITTDGTVATAQQLRACLERRISLCFSIDGPAPAHDSFRKFSGGRPTHRIAFENWQRYRELAGSVADAPGCEVSSVVAGDVRLPDIVRFWKEHGVPRFKAIPAEPSHYLGRRDLQDWETRRARYLEDLRDFAFSEATRLQGRDFEKYFEGPVGILDSWQRLNRVAPFRSCGAGYELIAVDADGAVFPCQGFIGQPARSIGNVKTGVVPAKLAEFRIARSRVRSSCNGCWARFLCDGGCCAGDPATGVVLDQWNGCQFTHAQIGRASWRE